MQNSPRHIFLTTLREITEKVDHDHVLFLVDFLLLIEGSSRKMQSLIVVKMTQIDIFKSISIENSRFTLLLLSQKQAYCLLDRAQPKE